VSYSFTPELYTAELTSIIEELLALEKIDSAALQKILRRYPKDQRGLFAKSEIIRGFRHLSKRRGWGIREEAFIERLRMKPIRTASGVAPVTVLTKPFPCPGQCIFCPSDVRMPKSYLSDEPGAQRAAQHRFDPYKQSLSRLLAYHNNGHKIDKIELIILGGTWSHYPEAYQIWFVKRCFDAMNDLPQFLTDEPPSWSPGRVDFSINDELVDGRAIDRRYNAIVTDFLNDHPETEEEAATWDELFETQTVNETGRSRCVGLVVETRPDNLTLDEVVRIRRLGATKVQIGFQSLSDEVLELNDRGHDVAATARAVRLLRSAGFKLHAHWMPNLYGSSPEADIEDFRRMFDDPAFRPDELKIYPCSLIQSAALMAYYEDGRWCPYEHAELLHVLTECLRVTPPYCRVTRVIRDIPGTDIVEGNRLTNFRELVEEDLDDRSVARQEIRSREVRFQEIEDGALTLTEIEYETCIGREWFLQFETTEEQLAAFLRLSLPAEQVPIAEISTSAMIREVHVYGVVVGLGERQDGRSQHLGLGTRLIERAAEIACDAGYADLAVISSVGTRDYYRRLGFEDGEMYQKRGVGA
jgi:elongator complex protein 3